MTNEELRALDLRIATEITGTICLCEKDKYGWSVHGYGSANGICYNCCQPHVTFPYSTDIQSAFEIVDKMCEPDSRMGHFFNLEAPHGTFSSPQSHMWEARFTQWSAYGETAAIAICLAALAAQEGMKALLPLEVPA
jgi:hypothetical protein